MSEGLEQAYVATCQQCYKTLIIYTAFKASARKRLTLAGWGKSENVYYCPDHVQAARLEVRIRTQHPAAKEAHHA